MRVNLFKNIKGIQFIQKFIISYKLFHKKTIKQKKNDSKLPISSNIYSLSLALRYLRAIEVGRPAHSSTIELHFRFLQKKRITPLKGYLELPFPARPYIKICVIAYDDIASKAKQAGAIIAGSDDIIEQIIKGEIQFDKCLAHTDALPLLEKISKIPGTKRWMPSIKNGTICSDIDKAIKMAMNGVYFKERNGILQIPLANLHYTDSKIQSNLRLFLEHIGFFNKKKQPKINPKYVKIVLSSPHGMGIVLDPLSI
ncbi:hypothetical protein PCANB_002030 [Pneumocystis canis]|nr:hypothetical protein PCK1_001908 [Pneumocystis canis]KAG5439456.1 hypothetical protein PCANB_002030 [Pneumocystis canis]